MDELLALRPLRNPAVEWRSVEGEVVLVSGEAREELNEVGSRIWEMCDGSRTVRSIATQIVEEFDVDDATAQRDTAEFVRELLEGELLLAGDGATAGPSA